MIQKGSVMERNTENSYEIGMNKHLMIIFLTHLFFDEDIVFQKMEPLSLAFQLR